MAKKKDEPPLTILQDRREQKPLPWGRGTEVEPATLKTGDLTTPLLKDKVVVERKATPSELAGNCTQARFLRELERAAESLQEFHLLLTFSLQDLQDWPRISNLPASVRSRIRITGRFVQKQLIEWQGKYPKLRVHFADNPTAARDYVVALFREAESRYSTPPPANI